MNKRQVHQLKIKESLSPEEILARSRIAKLRFRAAIRIVIYNLYWLADAEDEELGDDVQKNILLLIRKKGKKGLLSLKDKRILSKRAEYRTEAEKLHLSRKIGGLKCFRRYPAHVKTQLAGVTYFYYCKPGRTIVRQGHQSQGLYFILTGKVTISQESFDPVLNEMVNKEVGFMGEGSMFGEVALLHDIPRTSTVTCKTHVELLCVKKKDFDRVLKATVKEQWDSIRNAMRCFTYFDDWDTHTIQDCCVLGKLKTFLPDETIVGDGFGNTNYVYFILSGRCQVVEHLLVTTDIKRGRKLYKQYVPPAPADTPSNSDYTDLVEREPKEGEITSGQNETETKANDITDDPNTLELNRSVTFESNSISTTKSQASKKTMVDKHSFIKSRASSSYSSGSSKKPVSVSTDQKPSVRTTAAAVAMKHLLSSKNTSLGSSICLPPNVKTHFMQVCFLNATACFGIAENMKHRRVVATTNTECLLIPRYWLIRQNKGNIWNRVLQFLNSHIPTSKQVFKEFLNQRKWLAYRRKLIEDIMSNRKKISNNNINNVPYFIRINEEIDLY